MASFLNAVLLIASSTRKPFTKAWQLLSRLPIKIRKVTPGKGVSIEANDDNPLTRITWNGRLEDKFIFRSAVKLGMA